LSTAAIVANTGPAPRFPAKLIFGHFGLAAGGLLA